MKNEYLAKSYNEFIEKYNIELDLTQEQLDSIDAGDNIKLDDTQLDRLAEQLVAYEEIDEFIKDNCRALLPISFSLFVVNDKLWEMMKKKVWDPEKMLAMCTVPLCTWDKDYETTSNPKGIRRWPIKPNTLDIHFDNMTKLEIRGEGGDFSGFIEQSHLSTRKWGFPDSRRLIPNFIFQSIHIEALLGRAAIEISPEPREDFDYDFSDHARVFFEHGFVAHIPGEDVILQVGKGKPNRMAGDVYLLIGNRFIEKETQEQTLLADIWLKLFKKRMTR
jgi:hypothetical protein